MRNSWRCALVGCAWLAAIPLATSGEEIRYEAAPAATRWLESEASGVTIKMLVEQANLGGEEVEVGEIVFPAGYAGGAHVHRLEIFYILSGELDHVVNGESHILGPGMVGIVRAPDEVAHRVHSKAPVKAIVIWAPAGEADALARFFTERPVD